MGSIKTRFRKGLHQDALTAPRTELLYTLDGSDPTQSSTPYTTFLTVNPVGSYTLKLRAFTTSAQSDVVSMPFEIKS